MKKIMFTLMIFASLSVFAQEKMNLTPEQSATLRTKEMTLQLDLNDAQQKQVFELNEKLAIKRAQARVERTERKELTDEQRYEMRIARLDEMIAVKKEMKGILNEKQYEKWEVTMKDRGEKMRKARSKHRKGEHKRERSQE